MPTAPRTSLRAVPFFAFATLLSICAFIVSGCQPKVGGKCTSGQVVCADATNVLTCQGGVFVEARCGGAGGCSKLGTKVTCDDSTAEDGDRCLDAEIPSTACSTDKKRSLLCKDGTFKTIEMCRGAKGCQIHGESVTCDNHIAQRDDPCPVPNTFACSPDFKTRLLCKDGKMRFERFCRGQAGCRDFDLGCDESISEVGDPCGKTGTIGCSVDGKQELVCEGGQFVGQRQCKRTGCRVTANRQIECQ